MDWHLAQINVATARFATEDPRMAGFMRRLDEINALAEASPGFVWRLQSDSGNATDIDVGGGPLFLANMSVWESTERLFEFVYKTMHRDVMVRRREWFERPGGVYQVLWWIPKGELPTPEEGLERVAYLEAHGPTQHGFTFQKHFPPLGERDTTGKPFNPDEHCSGWE